MRLVPYFGKVPNSKSCCRYLCNGKSVMTRRSPILSDSREEERGCLSKGKRPINHHRALAGASWCYLVARA